MKKLKIVLLFSLFITFIFRYNSNIKSEYSDNKVIYGTILNCRANEDKTNITIKGKEKILVTYPNDYKCTLGEKIKAYGKISKPQNNTVFYLFNYKNYLLSKGIKNTFLANKIEKVDSNIEFKYRIKNKMINYIKCFKSKKYLMALILGDSSDIEKEVKENIQKSGISHLLAISGMHIMILSHLFITLFNKLFKNRTISLFLTCTILLFYIFITDYSPSVIRSVLLFISVRIKKETNIDISTPYIILFIFVSLLNLNPYYIYNLGFLLSFAVSFYLTVFSSIIQKSTNYFNKLFKISIISFLSSSPIIINSFFSLNVFSIFLNVIFVPLFSIIIYPLSLVTFLIKPFDILLYKITEIFEKISTSLSHIDFLTFTLSHMNISLIIIYYLVITSILYIYKKYEKNFIWIFILLLSFHSNIYYFKSSSISFIDVSQGDSILINLKNNNGNILIDTGGLVQNLDYNISEKKLIPFFKAEGIKKIDYLILTHGDYDHMGEAINLVNNFKIEKVIFNCGSFNDLEKELIKVLDKKHIKYYSCIKELNIDKNKLYFLQTKEYDNENDNSNVIYTELNGYKFMFMGDASSVTEKEILDRYNLPDIDVLKIGHHGSKTSSSKEFVDEIKPKYSVISVGKNNRYGHPNKEVLKNLVNSKIYRTDEDGSIMFKIKNNKLNIETCSP